MHLEKVWLQDRTRLQETPRSLRVVIVSLWAMVFAALCVIAYHLSFGAELYRRGQEHAAAEISMAAQQAGAAIAFQYEDDSLCVLLLRKKGCWQQARRSAETGDRRKEGLQPR